MSPKAPTDHPVHELIARRRSPYALDPNREIPAKTLASLFEAARWAASSYNAQPWRYIVGVKGRSQDVWDKIYSVLLEGNQPWALNAPVLALGLVQPHFEHNGKRNKAAEHDLGAASANLSLEATAHGLVVHQMIGIDPARARETFAVPAEFEPYTALAIAHPGAAEHIPETYAQRDAGARRRKSLDEILLAGNF